MSSYPPWQTKVRVSAVVDYKKKKTLVKKGVFLFKASFLPPQVIVGITVKTEMIF
jgi:hypothetical protein